MSNERLRHEVYQLRSQLKQRNNTTKPVASSADFQLVLGSSTTSSVKAGFAPPFETRRSVEQILVSASCWTEVTSDQELIEHLLSLYFVWEYPIFATLSKKHFLADFRSGSHTYCSSLLVNALLAIGCSFSDRREARMDAEKEETAGDHFFQEVKRLLSDQRGQSLETVQVLGLMSIREARCGRESESWFFAGQSIRLAIEMGLHINSLQNLTNVENEVRTATFWGAFTLDQ